MTKIQLQAKQQVKYAVDWILGGYENDILDGNREEMPSKEVLIDQIYEQVMTCTTYPGTVIYTPLKQIRFAGKKFILDEIEKELN